MDYQELLFAFFRMVREYDPDTLIRWNLIGVDLEHSVPFLGN